MRKPLPAVGEVPEDYQSRLRAWKKRSKQLRTTKRERGGKLQVY